MWPLRPESPFSLFAFLFSLLFFCGCFLFLFYCFPLRLNSFLLWTPKRIVCNYYVDGWLTETRSWDCGVKIESPFVGCDEVDGRL